MLCPHCGTNNHDTAVNCSGCGKWLPLPATRQEGGSAIPMNPPREERPAAPADVPHQTAPPANPPGPAWNAPPPAVPIPGMPYVAAPGNLSPLAAHGSLSAVPAYSGTMLYCKVCGAALYPGQQTCTRCKTPPGYIVNPNDPTATTFLQFGKPVPLVPVLRIMPASSGGLAERLGGWNWGAALLPTVWSARHRIAWLAWASGLVTFLMFSLLLLAAGLHRAPDAKGTLTGLLVSFLLIFWLPRSIFTGLRGNSLAWRSGLYADKEILQKAQRSWTLWAIIGVTGVCIALAITISILLAT